MTRRHEYSGLAFDQVDDIAADLSPADIAAEIESARPEIVKIVDAALPGLDGPARLHAVRSVTAPAHVTVHAERLAYANGQILGVSRFLGRRRAQGRS
jgi:hypothetical protein